MIQSEFKVSRPISSSQSSQMLKNATLQTITQQITKSRYQTVNKVKLASKHDVINEENALLSQLQARENAICQTPCRVFELNFSDFQKIFNSQVNEIRHRMSMLSKYFNLEEIDQSAILSFCQGCCEQSYVCGDKIYSVGEKVTGFYFVKSGTVEISCVPSTLGKSQQIVIDLVNSTEFCGLEEVFNQNQNRVYDAFVQSEKLKILYIPISYFDQDRNFAHSEMGKMDLYKALMRLSKEKTRRYASQLEKFKEQINQQSLSSKHIRVKSSQSQRVSIQEILTTENKVNRRYHYSISDNTSKHNFAAADVPQNPSFPCVLPPKPYTHQKQQSFCNSKSGQSQSCLSTILKMRIRNSSQAMVKSNSGRFFNNECPSKKRESDILNQTCELGSQSQLMQTTTAMNNQPNFDNLTNHDQIPIHSLSATRQQSQNGCGTSSINCNYKVLFKKYLDQKNKSSTQYSAALNASNLSKEKQMQILNEMDQKLLQAKQEADEKNQPNFMISTFNNTLKSLSKNQQEKQQIQYGGTLFNNLMLSNSMKYPLQDQTNNLTDEQMTGQQKILEKLFSYKANGKLRVTMTSFKSNKNIKQKENCDPVNLQNNSQIFQNDDDSVLNLQMSEENSPLKKKYSMAQKDSKQILYKKQISQVKSKKLSFSENKSRTSSILDSTTTPFEIKNENEQKQPVFIQNQNQRKSLTPLRQAQINIQHLNFLKQNQQTKVVLNSHQDNKQLRRMVTESFAPLRQQQKKELDYSYEDEPSEASILSKESFLSQDSDIQINNQK